jgi:aspartate aminotransferase-like enzyme
MVQAMINITEHSNRILNIIKAKYGLRDKSEAINIVVEEYEVAVLEPELRPEYVKKALKIHKQPSIKVGAVENLRKRYEK